MNSFFLRDSRLLIWSKIIWIPLSWKRLLEIHTRSRGEHPCGCTFTCVFSSSCSMSLFTDTLSSKHCVSMKYVSPFSVTSIFLYYFQYMHIWVTFLVSLSLLLAFDFLIELSSAFSAVTVLLSFPLFHYSLRQNKIAREEKSFFAPSWDPCHKTPRIN